MILKKLFTITLLLGKFAFGQNPAELKQIIAPSPTAANLAAAIDFPVGPYTGTPNISLPIWTIKAGDLSLPITLSYASGGIKVADMASWCGLGWNLNVGGIVTRAIHGLPDEDPAVGYIAMMPAPAPSIENKFFYAGFALGTRDSEQDLFFFSTPTVSGRFVFNEDGVPQAIPRQNYKITYSNPLNISFPTPNTGPKFRIPAWQIIDDKGNICRYTHYDRMVTSSRNNHTMSGWSEIGLNVNSWYLSEIVTPSGEKITYHYSDVDLSYDLPPNKTAEITLAGTCESSFFENVQRQRVVTKRLSSIEFPDGKIKFIASTMQRADFIGDNPLDKIVIENNAGEIVRQFKMDYRYLVGNSLLLPSAINVTGENNFFASGTIDPAPSFSRRLMLVNIQELDKNVSPVNSGYSFEYLHSIGLPNRASPRTDHWGFANNPDIVTQSLPELLVVPGQTLLEPNIYITEKSSNFEYAKEGSLYKIAYPTGGTVEYSYESNEAPPGPMIPPKAIKVPAIHSISIAHTGYNNDGTYEGYEYVMRPDPLGNNCRHYYVNFTVLPNTVNNAKIVVTDMPYFPAGSMGFYIENLNNPNHAVWTATNNGTYYFYLAPGNYRLYHYPSYALLNNPQHPDFGKLYNATISDLFTVTTVSDAPGSAHKVGGLRIKQTKQFDPQTQKAVFKKYTYSVEGSSGQLLSTPLYSYRFRKLELENAAFIECDFVGISYNSISALNTTHNSYVGYTFVEEQILSEAGAPLGKTEYSYNFSPDITYQVAGGVHTPFTWYDAANPPVDRRDWQRGFLTNQSEYAFKNGYFTPIKQVENYYSAPTVVASQGLQVVLKTRYYNGNHEMSLINYNHSTGSIFVDSTIELLHDNGALIKKTTAYENSALSFLPTKKRETVSDGNTLTEYLSYPKEYLSGSGFVDSLISKNIVSVPIEMVKTEKSIGGSERIIGGLLNTYYPSGKGLVKSIDALKISTPLAFSGFKFSNAPVGQIPGLNNRSVYAIDPKYENRVQYNKYDTRGNLLEQQKANDVKEVYLWGYNGQYPVAKISGSDYVTVDLVVDTALLNNPTTTAVQIRTELQKLRTDSRTKDALVASYTYNPLVGMTSETDPTGKLTLYEYDSFGRLNFMKDEQGNILKKICYNYAGQVVNCNQ